MERNACIYIISASRPSPLRAVGYGVAVVYAPGDRVVIVGTKEGRIQVVGCGG